MDAGDALLAVAQGRGRKNGKRPQATLGFFDHSLANARGSFHCLFLLVLIM
jgi:hypothetical protein